MEERCITLRIVIPRQVVTYTRDQLEQWVRGEREDCIDSYCRGLPGSMGFGEHVVGKHFESRGYLWIHHNYNVLGGNRPGKYPHAEEVVRKYLDRRADGLSLPPGQDRLAILRGVYWLEKPGSSEGPDLLAYRPDCSELRFAEAKRTRDRVRPEQIRGLVLLAVLLDCVVEVYDVVQEGQGSPSETEIHYDLPFAPTH